MPATAPATVTGDAMHPRAPGGFTLVELLLVLFVVALLASLVAPVVTKSVEQAKEATLKEDLQVMRKAIDDFYADTGRYPEALAQLAEKRYIRKLPIDPMTERADSWIEVRHEGPGGGIIDVRSGAEGKSAEGVAYRDW
jgi:general secretion pathway protein G